MSISVKAKSLREGDKILLDDGTEAVVKRAKSFKKVIPRQTAEFSSVQIVVRHKRNGRTSIGVENLLIPSDDSFSLKERKGFAWKRSQFMKKHSGYVNALALACTGAVLSTVLGLTGIVPMVLAQSMLGGTFAASVALAYMEYKRG